MYEQVLVMTRQMAVEQGCPLLLKALELNNRSWTPHCTLGKIRAPKSKIVEVGTSVIQRLQERCIVQEEREDAKEMQHVSSSLSMKGTLPKQLWVDWEALLQFPQQHHCDTDPPL
jgi:hypothetical protein